MNDDLYSDPSAGDLDTEDLNGVLSRRAERARPAGDPDDVVADVIALAANRTRARRNRLAIASGAAVVVVAATVGIAIADTGSATPHHPSGQPAGQGVGNRVPVHPSASRVTELPKISPLEKHAEQKARQKRLEMQQARRAARHQLQQARRAHRNQLTHPTLMPVDPAPKQAEISLGLVPEGFQYLSLDDADTFYGEQGLSPTDYFSQGIVVDVHLFIGSAKDYTLTVNGMPASYHKSDGYTLVRVRYSKKVDVGFQAPPQVALTEAQALKMAATLDVRSTRHKTKG